MNILAFYMNMPSTVVVYSNGKILSATHEERYSRRKNDNAFPQKAMQYCMDSLGRDKVEYVAIASRNASLEQILFCQYQWSVDDYLLEQHEIWKPRLLGVGEKKSLLELFRDRVDVSSYPSDYLSDAYKAPETCQSFDEARINIVSDITGVSKDNIRLIEHHRSHAAYSYYASPFRKEKVLSFTVDGWGDGLNATIGVFDEAGKFVRHYETDQCNIGRIYRYMTLLLGMKPNEHEFKVMGLAPYGREKYARKALDVFRSTLYVDGLEFKWHEKPVDSYFWFKERLEGVRFDNIAYALQTWTEELLCLWVKNAIRHFGIHKIVLSGGVAMNIKAMGSIADLPEVEDMFVGGTATDDSLPVGAAICMAEDLTREAGKDWDSGNVRSLPHLYLGPDNSDEEESALISSIDADEFCIVENPENELVARHLVEGRVIARCAGRMEFGQRALGNRSILADPSDLRVKDKINSMIKSRDFWMPFAPVVLDTYVDRYLINPKDIQSPHMTIGFATTDEGFDAMIAACHPADRTARAQILVRSSNPELYDLIKSFEKITGRGALLNTSFNLHGFPIVRTPRDAFDVFVNSGLDGLLLNRRLILKK